ncbi:MAG: PQQ-dependent dehydrogenase, methanol/ethanol family [Gammaproteobacteria bacterium]|jgi:quinohemoprotein ethanol dehydrogenase|nr:PQQ-dependent dehydrogenase, methanol/ethanol family [Gammaproteobacteria bacterium]
MAKHARIALALGLAAGLMSTGAFSATTVDGAAIANEQDTGNWLSYGRTYSEQRYSPLDQINENTVAGLKADWALELPTDRTLLATPIVVDGVMYISGSYSVVRAVDAQSGKVLWTYDPKTLEVAGDRQRIFWDSNRGVAFWKGKVFVATGDGRLNAIDAKTGKEVWSAVTIDPKLPMYINGAPRVFRDKVIIGNGGTEVGANRGYVTAYDTETGKQAWRFYIVPGNPADGFEDETQAMAAKTWTGEWWKHGGGGNTWNGFTYDPEFNRIYIGTGNGSPWNRNIRSPGGGDNLFLCSIVALDADTGKYAWHYQTTPGETWDYNSNMDIVLADLNIDGKPVKALMHAPKNGFFYVIDRSTGKLISAEKFGKVDWAEYVDLKTGRPVERKGARYEDGQELVWPSPFGIHNWHAMSFNPNTGLAYIPVMELPGMFTDKGIDRSIWQSPNFSIDPGVEFAREDIPVNAGTGALRAWDPVAQKLRWEVKLPGVWNPGTLTTGGNLVIQGRTDGKLVAYRATDGESLWQFDAGLGISAPPVTYTVNGKQHIALLVGWGGAGPAVGGSLQAQHGWAYRAQPRRLISFSLEGKADLPKLPPPSFAKPLKQEDFKVDEMLAQQGNVLWAKHCVLCHGAGAVSGGYAPDLRASTIPLYDAALQDVVVKGSRQAAGMPRFHEFSAGDLKALQHYIRREARR